MNLEHLRGWWKGADCVVVGCGPSAHKHTAPAPPTHYYRQYWTLACNRSIQFAAPDVGICFEAPGDKEMWRMMNEIALPFVFSHLAHPRHPRAITVDRDVSQWLGGSEKLRLNQSTFYGLAVAAALGFETLGVVGLDLTGPRWSGTIDTEERLYGRLRDTITEATGARVVNLNPESRLQAFEKGPWSEVRTK